MKTTIFHLVWLFLLFAAGFLSPSNGFDDRAHIDSDAMTGRLIWIMFPALAWLLFRAITKFVLKFRVFKADNPDFRSDMNDHDYRKAAIA